MPRQRENSVGNAKDHMGPEVRPANESEVVSAAGAHRVAWFHPCVPSKGLTDENQERRDALLSRAESPCPCQCEPIEEPRKNPFVIGLRVASHVEHEPALRALRPMPLKHLPVWDREEDVPPRDAGELPERFTALPLPEMFHDLRGHHEVERRVAERNADSVRLDRRDAEAVYLPKGVSCEIQCNHAGHPLRDFARDDARPTADIESGCHVLGEMVHRVLCAVPLHLRPIVLRPEDFRLVEVPGFGQFPTSNGPTLRHHISHVTPDTFKPCLAVGAASHSPEAQANSAPIPAAEECPKLTDIRVLFVQDRICMRTWNEARTLTRAGIDVSLLELRDTTLLGEAAYATFTSHEHIPVAPDIRNIARDGRLIKAHLRRAVREGSYDLVHTHNEPDFFGAWASETLDVPVIHDIHDIVTEAPITWAKGARRAVITRLYRRWESAACRKADALLTVTPLMADYFRKKYRLERVHVVVNKPVRVTVERLPKLSQRDGRVRVVFAGNFARVGGYILESLVGLAERGIEVHAYPAWSTADAAKDAGNRVKSVRDFHLHGFVPPDRVLREISQYDYGVLWSADPRDVNNRLTCPNKMHEARVAGLHIITNLRDGYVGDYVTRNRCGIVVDSVKEVPADLSPPVVQPIDPDEHFMNAREILAVYESIGLGG